MKLCGALFSNVTEVDGDFVHLRASHGFAGEALASLQRRSVNPRDAHFPSGQAIRERVIVHLPDTDVSRYRELGRERGFRSFVTVPMLRGSDVVGTIAVARTEPGAFSDRQIALLRTFAAQVGDRHRERARLFQELQARNRELTEAARAADGDRRDPAGDLRARRPTSSRSCDAVGQSACARRAAPSPVRSSSDLDGSLIHRVAAAARHAATGAFCRHRARVASPAGLGRRASGGDAERAPTIHVEDILRCRDPEFPSWSRTSYAQAGVPDRRWPRHMLREAAMPVGDHRSTPARTRSGPSLQTADRAFGRPSPTRR